MDMPYFLSLHLLMDTWFVSTIFAIVSKAMINTVTELSVWFSLLFQIYSGSVISESYGNSAFRFLKNFHIRKIRKSDFLGNWKIGYSHQKCMRAPISLHLHQHFKPIAIHTSVERLGIFLIIPIFYPETLWDLERKKLWARLGS